MNRFLGKRTVKFGLLAVVAALLVICGLGGTARLPVWASMSPLISQIDRHSEEYKLGRDVPGMDVSDRTAKRPFAPTMKIVQTIDREALEEAASLTLQGHEQLALGNARAALEIWQTAEDIYTRLGKQEGIAGSLINQSLALQAQGRSRRACRIVLEALAVSDANAAEFDWAENDWCEPFPEVGANGRSPLHDIAPSLVNAIGLRSLGDLLRSIGNLDLSESALDRSLEMMTREPELTSIPNIEAEIEATQLSLGNTYRAHYWQQRDLFDRTEDEKEQSDAVSEAIDRATYALNAYLESDRDLGSSVGVRAKLNRLSLSIEIARWLKDEKVKWISDDDVESKQRQFQAQIEPLLTELLANSSLLTYQTGIELIYDRLNFARSLSQWQELDRAIEYTSLALELAENLDNSRAEAYALGTLGGLYEKQENFDLAREFTESATAIAQSIQAWDMAYQWQAQLGRIYKTTEETEKALDFYKAAIDTLALVQIDRLSLHADIQFSFLKDVRPIYEETLNLLLPPTSPSPSQDDLKTAIEINEKFQRAELENFLSCNLQGLGQDERERDKRLEKQEKLATSTDTIVYIMVLETLGRVIEIVDNPKDDLLNYYSLNNKEQLKEIQESVYILKRNLSDSSIEYLRESDDILPYSSSLYKLLIASIEKYFSSDGTLVFILDSTLQSIPISIFQDEDDDNRYLIQKYSLLLRPAAKSRQEYPHNSSEKGAEVLSGAIAAGLSEESTSFQEAKCGYTPFSPLENVPQELSEIAEYVGETTKILDRDFTVESLLQQLNNSRVPILHIATHGCFSSNPQKTFILAYDKLITIPKMDLLLRNRTESSFYPIDLLVLSACQTAKDDKRGGLGLAGVALQAGAKSTVASLWNISDRSTVYFMKEFYQALNNPNIFTKSEALRKAQLAFLDNQNYQEYQSPYYWAAFVLVESQV